MQSNFDFIDTEIKNIRGFATKAEMRAKLDPRYACFQSRFTAETAVKWLYDVDHELRLPYNTMLGSLMTQPEFQRLVPIQAKRSLEVIRRYGNMAAHSDRAIPAQDAVICVHQLHNFLFWLNRTYFEVNIEAKFDSSIIPDGKTIQRKRAEIEKLAQEREEEQKKLEDRLEEERSSNKALEDEIKKLRAQVAANKAEAEQVTDTHDYTEEQTRKALIDVLLKEAGWHSGSKNFAEEYELDGVERNVDRTGKGFADYVLFDDNGLPLAVIEAKKTSKDARQGKHQAVDYANALEKKFNQRPVIFYTNGYDHYIWDDHFYPERKVQGFYKKDELQVLIERRKIRKSILNPEINKDTVERPYQTLAINAVTEHFEAKNQRRALVVMATGSGKTRTTIALVEVLQKANWAKRVLFLCDRDSLVRQAKTAFKNHLPNTPAVDFPPE
jgi:type I restriction enzyme R subunit